MFAKQVLHTNSTYCVFIEVFVTSEKRETLTNLKIVTNIQENRCKLLLYFVAMRLIIVMSGLLLSCGYKAVNLQAEFN